LATLTDKIKSSRKRMTDIQEQAEQPFEHADKLTAFVQRQQEITDALDLNKNQASNQLDAQANETTQEVVQTIESPSQKQDEHNRHEIATADKSTIGNPSRPKKHGIRV